MSSSRPLLLSIALGVAALLLDTSLLLAKNGYYSVSEIDGVWWFVNPNGEPFYSLGVCDIGPGPSREQYNPARPSYAAFRHYDSNEAWAEHTVQRLTEWNFNTIGGWADDELTRGPLPYAVVLHMGSELGFPWNDVFSDEFAATLDQLARERVLPRRDDKNLLGWFSDNEQGWYPDALFSYHLSQPATSATRTEMIKLLSDEYESNFAALQQDFDVVGAASFDELSRGGELKLRPEGHGRRVIMQFAGALAERYYKVVHDSIRRYDPHHLILGDRYAWHCPHVVAQAAGPHVDVVSTNLDWPEAADGYLPAGYLRSLHRLTGRPVLVTEYYVAARQNRSGNPNTGGIFLTVETQQDRTAAAVTRLRRLIEQPYVVGAHWFRYADEPTHGRLTDGEDYNFGLVDIDNRPYRKLTAAMTRLQADIPQIHRQCAATSIVPSGEIAVPFLPTEASDLHTRLANAAELAVQDDSLQVYEILGAWTSGNIYLAALVCHVADTGTFSTAAAPLKHSLECEITSPSFDKSLAVPFPTENGTSNVAGVECWRLAKGLRQTVVFALPARAFGKSRFEADEQIRVNISINDMLNKKSVGSDYELRLARDARHNGRSPDQDSAAE